MGRADYGSNWAIDLLFLCIDFEHLGSMNSMCSESQASNGLQC